VVRVDRTPLDSLLAAVVNFCLRHERYQTAGKIVENRSLAHKIAQMVERVSVNPFRKAFSTFFQNSSPELPLKWDIAADNRPRNGRATLRTLSDRIAVFSDSRP
jgi:hypothetical protein